MFTDMLSTTVLAAGRRALLAALPVLAATGGTAVAAEPIRIGVPVGLSGANSVVAPSVVQAATLAVEQINAKGGVLGRKLELVVADDASGAAGAQQAFNSLAFQKQVDVVVSMETSAARNAALPIVTKADIPYIYTSFYEGHSCNRNLFVDAWVPEQQVPPLVDHFAKDLHARKFFLIGSDYAFGRGMLDFARKRVVQDGASVVGEEYLPIDSSDWTSVISKLRASGADAILSATAGGAPNVTLTKQLRAAGVSLPFGNLAVDEGTARTLGADASGVFLSASYLTGIDSAANKAFLDALHQRFGAATRTPNDLSVPEYDGIYLYKAAVEKAGSTDTHKVEAALAEVSFTGPRGTISMSVQHHAPITMYLGQIQSDGAVKVIGSAAAVSPGSQCPNL